MQAESCWPCLTVTTSTMSGPSADAYLHALATHHGGRFVTFDRSVALSAVPAATRDNLTVL